MSKVIMMCGVCGSGKTTYAKKKEKEGYIRLSIDEEMWKLHGKKGVDYPDSQYEELSEKIEAALRKKMLGLINWTVKSFIKKNNPFMAICGIFKLQHC